MYTFEYINEKLV